MRQRTFMLGKLYFQFLRPKGIPIQQLPFLVTKLYEAEFIVVYASNGALLEDERYTETPKLLSGENRDELFKIIESLKEPKETA
jgi:hypothetical protein